ncbi:hypothetical protein BSKO_06809 [Bryopsis sp. KO-2023]|nr:hypothetical protein BSKO_06809 [Bryopsis sp. KO-2023]
MSQSGERRCLNVNVGVLGHVDSGKTSLVAALSTVLSTAALDKHPQSKERGITLDLGFSAFIVPLPEHLSKLSYDSLQFTLVDCPGHASLIRTIIGGAHIMDLVLLVIDITKGIQVQTAECLVVGEITTQQMVVVLNKIDMLDEADRDRAIRKAKKHLSQTFKMTKFAASKMIPVSAKPGGDGEPVGVHAVAEELVSMVKSPPPRRQGPFLFAIDHCFQIKGHGTILTGTALQGDVKVNDMIEIPHLKEKRKIKSMQTFKRNVDRLTAGDRAGICVPGLDASKIERGLAAVPQTVPTFKGAIAWLDKVRFYSGNVASNSKFHVTVGHTTVMATVSFFGFPDGGRESQQGAMQLVLGRLNRIAAKKPPPAFDYGKEYEHQDELHGMESNPKSVRFGNQFALLNFELPLTAPSDSVLIGARLDADLESSSCRLAFYGQVMSLIDTDDKAALKILKIFKWKNRQGVIERLNPDKTTAICKSMFKKETDLSVFVGMKVTALGTGDEGKIEGSFGGGGKFRVYFENGLQAAWEADKRLDLKFKRFIFDTSKKTPRQ